MFTDQIQHVVDVPITPQRIVSLVPSQTELLYDLGLESEVIGITKFCIHPNQWFQMKQRIGGTKNIQLEKLLSLQPDLVIANREENVKEQVELLAAHVPVWTSDINNLEDALKMIAEIGRMTERDDTATTIIQRIENGFAQLPALDAKPRTAYLIWKNPYMTVGNDTFIHDMLSRNGFDNIFQDQKRYPTITIEDLKTNDCQLLLLSSEPYPFQQKHSDELQRQLPDTKIMLVDGEMFSWYGSRLMHATAYFQTLHKQICAKA